LGDYNAVIDRVNDLLRAHCTGTVGFWKHQHSVLGGHFSDNGIHLHDHSLKAFRDSIIHVISHYH